MEKTDGIIKITEYCKQLNDKANDKSTYRNLNHKHELIFRGESNCCDEIKSGAAHRLTPNSKVLNQTEFLDYHRAIINKAKGIIQDTTKNDLEILLEIQHNKGATCLIEYTTSFLIALWFACSESPDTDGRVFFIDLKNEEHEGDVEVLTEGIIKQHQTEPFLIISLLKHKAHKRKKNQTFWVWKPKLSDKSFLLAQKCLYVFGLAASSLLHKKENSILIEQREKNNILKALAAYFGINQESLFPDIPSFSCAQNHSVSPSSLIDNQSNQFAEGLFYEENGNYEEATEIYEALLKKTEKKFSKQEHPVETQSLEHPAKENDQIFPYQVARKLGKCYVQRAKNLRKKYKCNGNNCFKCDKECKTYQKKAAAKFTKACELVQNLKESNCASEYENKIRYELADVYYDIQDYEHVLEQYEKIFDSQKNSESKDIDLLACAELSMFLEKSRKQDSSSEKDASINKSEIFYQKYKNFLDDAHKEIDKKMISEPQANYLKIIEDVIIFQHNTLTTNNFNDDTWKNIKEKFNEYANNNNYPKLLWNFNDAKDAFQNISDLINAAAFEQLNKSIDDLNELNDRLKSDRYSFELA